MNITLASNNYEVTIQTLGAELKSFCSPAGKEFVWNANPDFWMRSSPLLFPAIGNVRENKTVIDGTAYPMPKHGFCKDLEFSVTAQSTDSVTLALCDNETTRESYPFGFLLTLTYVLDGSRLSMTYRVSNRDTRTMPYHLGAHPGFFCPLEDGEAFSDYVLEFEKEERLEATVYDLKQLCFSSTKKHLYHEHTRTLPLNAEMFDEDAVFFPHTASRAVALVNPSTGKGIHMDYTDFCSIAFWTPSGGKAPFLCLEPWNGAAIYDDEDDIFSHKRDIELLAPGEDKDYRLGISLLGY